MRRMTVQRGFDEILRDRVVVRGIERSDSIDFAVVLGEPDHAPVGSDAVWVGVCARCLEVLMAVRRRIEGSHGRNEVLGVPDLSSYEGEIPRSTSSGQRPLPEELAG